MVTVGGSNCANAPNARDLDRHGHLRQICADREKQAAVLGMPGAAEAEKAWISRSKSAICLARFAGN